MANAYRIEERTLQGNTRCCVQHLGVLSTHDPCQRNGLFLIADQQIIGPEFSLFGIEGDKHLPFFCLPHDNAAACNQGIVERMQGLSILQKYIVRNIDNVINGPHLGLEQPSSHDERALFDLHVFKHPGCISRAGIFCDNLDTQD